MQNTFHLPDRFDPKWAMDPSTRSAVKGMLSQRGCNPNEYRNVIAIILFSLEPNDPTIPRTHNDKSMLEAAIAFRKLFTGEVYVNDIDFSQILASTVHLFTTWKEGDVNKIVCTIMDEIIEHRMKGKDIENILTKLRVIAPHMVQEARDLGSRDWGQWEKNT